MEKSNYSLKQRIFFRFLKYTGKTLYSLLLTFVVIIAIYQSSGMNVCLSMLNSVYISSVSCKLIMYNLYKSIFLVRSEATLWLEKTFSLSVRKSKGKRIFLSWSSRKKAVFWWRVCTLLGPLVYPSGYNIYKDCAIFFIFPIIHTNDYIFLTIF